MARGEPQRPGSQLPAPYRNPWSALAEALRAVVADQRLSLQRLWRRNREGELPLPGLWPQDLAPLFWPLLLVLGLALVIVLGTWLLGVLRPLPPPAADGTAKSELSRPVERSERQPVSGAQSQGWGGAPTAAGPDTPLAPQKAAPVRGPGPAGSEPANPEAGPSPVENVAVAAPELQLDPLLELLSQGEGAGLLLAARPDPGSSRLRLTLSEAAEALPQAELLEWAQRWQRQAREAGYERLELCDRQARLRGRGALVGSGMILLAPVPTA